MESRVQRIGSERAGILLIQFNQAADHLAGFSIAGGKIVRFEFETFVENKR